MKEKERIVYHIVTRNKMKVGQIMNFDKEQKNTLYRFFFETEKRNSKGEDFTQILSGHYTNDGINLTKKMPM